MDMARSGLAAALLLGVAVALSGCGNPAAGGAGGAKGPDRRQDVKGAGSSATDGGKRAAGGSGPSAPDFSLASLDGPTVRLSDYLGKKVVLIDFWSTTCHPCLQEMPELVALYHKYKDRGFVILGVATDDPDTRAQVSAEVRSKKMDFPVLLDDETVVLDRYNPKGELPFAVLIDRRGSIVLKRASYQAGDEKSMQTLRAAIEQALGAP
jgi:peroxiredoxin